MSAPDVCDPWPVDLCCKLPEDLDEAVIEKWARVASQILFRLSGRRWGPSCPITVRPCKQACAEGTAGAGAFAGQSTGGWVPYKGPDGVWRNGAVCGCTSSCSCTELCEMRLDGPVYDIVEVLEDGEALAPEAYRVDAANLLVRTDGECWPTCQDMAAPCGAEGTLCVTYRTGLRLDESAIAAVSELTCHLLKGCNPGGGCGCRANPNLTRVQRQGVEIERPDPFQVYADGRTGLPLADLWLSAVNPYGQPSASRVYSPDFRRPRRTTWP
ncbi:hypothetical protein [Streptomyces sp. NPDC007346]|uniref:hypothetical protein n=1 Tax=Streptomyces sp. NPDC007346 TaxID=3154682 RepID=UPI003452FF42